MVDLMPEQAQLRRRYCFVSLQDAPLDTNAFYCTVCKMSQATQYKLVYIN